MDVVSVKPSNAKTSRSARTKRVLLVDDEELVRDVTQRLLVRLEMDVTSAEGLQTAREALQKSQESFDFALVDLTLLDGSCQELLEEVIRHSPDAFLAVMSGYDGTQMPQIPKRSVAFLQKPFQNKALKELLMEAGLIDGDEGGGMA